MQRDGIHPYDRTRLVLGGTPHGWAQIFFCARFIVSHLGDDWRKMPHAAEALNHYAARLGWHYGA